DRAAAADPHDRVGAEIHPRHHPRRDRDPLPDEGVVPDLDPLLPEDRPGGEGDARAFAEVAEAVPRGGSGVERGRLPEAVPPPVDQPAERALYDRHSRTNYPVVPAPATGGSGPATRGSRT